MRLFVTRDVLNCPVCITCVFYWGKSKQKNIINQLKIGIESKRKRRNDIILIIFMLAKAI